MKYVLGIDLGTSSLKGVLVNPSGTVVAEHSVTYPLLTPKPGFSEQDPQDWLHACDAVFEELKSKVDDFTENLEGISFSGQMHSLVILDEEKSILRPAILWNDTRTSQQCREIMAHFGKEMLQITKNKAFEGFTLPKILWLQENEPEIWERACYIQLPKDYLRFYLTDKLNMDYSDAAGTLLLDVNNKCWSDAVRKQFKLDKLRFPQLVPSGACVGCLKQSIKEKFGFKHDVKVFAGGADNACAALGAGVLQSDVGLCSVGTSGVFLSLESRDDIDYEGKLHLFNHVIADANYSMGVTLAAGSSLNWFRDTFAKGMDFSLLLRDIKTVPPGSEGLLFAPYIVGERMPYADSTIRGSFVGIDVHHRLQHFTRAVIEGITFSLKDLLTIMETAKQKKFTKIISVGGAAKNTDWLQIQANIFNSTVVSLKTEQGPALGAAILAAVGVGWFSSLEEAVEVFVSYTKCFQPIPENVAAYQRSYSKYCKLYPALKSIGDS